MSLSLSLAVYIHIYYTRINAMCHYACAVRQSSSRIVGRVFVEKQGEVNRTTIIKLSSFVCLTTTNSFTLYAGVHVDDRGATTSCIFAALSFFFLYRFPWIPSFSRSLTLRWNFQTHTDTLMSKTLQFEELWLYAFFAPLLLFFSLHIHFSPLVFFLFFR